MPDYSFQIHAAQKIAHDCEDPRFLGAVLASAVGSGKTQTLIHAMNLIVNRNPRARILYLAYAQTAIKDQTLEAFSNPLNPVKINFTFGSLGSNCQVEVAIPQEFKKGKVSGGYTHLCIDEAHVWMASPSVMDRIVKRFGIDKLILASGTVSCFNNYNRWTSGRKFAITYIAGEEMLRRGAYSSVAVDLVRVPSYSETAKILKLTWQKAKAQGDNLSRPVVVCNSTKQAIEASDALKSLGYSTALAASSCDPQNHAISTFIAGDAQSLVLVNRGILGLNIPMATMILFLKQTKNIELILQSMARIFRVDASVAQKTFWMPATSDDWNPKIALLQQTLSLNKLEVMKTYCGPTKPRAA